jgi:PBP4 family serine-type D-alanyl-D-alanine carboxypeptidase|tara:strand:+ start:532 stop:1920 length:1389 start_codon:yes stop_codon:yes gene_type:complete
MIYKILILCCTSLLLSCSSTSLFPFNIPKNQIDKIIKNNQSKASISIKIVSLSDESTLYELNSEKLMTPASNLKLITAAASLHFLGTNYSYKTYVGYKDKDLILIGNGDPTLSIQTLDSLSNIVSKKIKKVNTLFLDATSMDSIKYGQGWMWDEGSEEFSAPIGALTLNNNCINIEYSPGKPGEPATINIQPNTQYISISNQSSTVDDTINFKKLEINRDWLNQTNNFTISGEIFIETTVDTIKKNISNPTLFTGTVFKEFLNNAGLQINNIEIGATKETIDTIAEHTSDSLKHILKSIMYESDNLSSELLIKTIGRDKNSLGTSESGLKMIKIFLADDVGVDTSEIRIVDGSGLSRYNLLSTEQIVQLLIYMNKTDLKSSFIEVLPHGGEKGSRLEDRLITSGEKIHAKTGSISGVSSLSGYALSPKYGPLAFSIIINGFVGSPYEYRQIQDQICEWMIED